MDYAERSLVEHRRLSGKIGISVKAELIDKDDLATFYSPGVGAVSAAIAADHSKVWEYTWRKHTVAIISDGSAVLGLGNIGPDAAQPVMAGKALLFKQFGDLDAIPLVLDTQDQDEIIRVIKALAPSFGGINLEDISAPRCFAIEAALQDLGIPVMHDDQHGTAVVALAGLINAAKVTGRTLPELKIVVLGAGAGGTAVAKMILGASGNKADIIMLDSVGIIGNHRTDLNDEKKELCSITNLKGVEGGLNEALVGADVFIGLSKGNLMKPEHIALMAKEPIIFALANPTPEIMPDLAYEAGAAVVATGRSDFPNQVNNVLAFPGIFKGALGAGALRITPTMLYAAAYALAEATPNVSKQMILPDPLEANVADIVAKAVADVAIQEGNVRK